MITLYVVASLVAVIFAAIGVPVVAIGSMLVFFAIWAIKIHQQHIAPRIHRYPPRRVH